MLNNNILIRIFTAAFIVIAATAGQAAATATNAGEMGVENVFDFEFRGDIQQVFLSIWAVIWWRKYDSLFGGVVQCGRKASR